MAEKTPKLPSWLNLQGWTIIVLILAVVVLSWLLFNERAESPSMDDQDQTTVTNFAECEAAGFPIGESFPRQCFAPNGQTYVEEIDQDDENDDEPTTRTYTSLKGVTIELENLAPNQVISSPFTLKGRVPGNWSFEASFPVVLTDWDGLIIAEKPAQIVGEWMTTELVPFEVTLEFDTPSVRPNGALILQKDNPSGLPENDDAVEISVNFKQE